VSRQARFYTSLFVEEHYDPYCGYLVGGIVPPEALIITSSRTPMTHEGVANNYQNPVLMYFSDRRGFSMAIEQHVPDFVERARAQGAAYLVTRYTPLPDEHPTLFRYLEENATEIGLGLEGGCAIYRFHGGRELVDPASNP
jgi:hypothetical protein